MQTRVCDTKSSLSRLPKRRTASYRRAVFSLRLLLTLLSNQTCLAAVCLEKTFNWKVPASLRSPSRLIRWKHSMISRSLKPAAFPCFKLCRWPTTFFCFKFKAKFIFRQLRYCARNFSSRRSQLTWQWWTPRAVKWPELKCPHNRQACRRLAHLKLFFAGH